MTTPLEIISPRRRDLGGFEVLRVLPAPQRKLVGPFIFLDQIGPADFEPGQGIDVRPHPHIGLATVTYLFEGALLHRDSLGSLQEIRPGDVNWMTAGRGIVHSERTPPELRGPGHRLFGLQTWVALPATDEECEPAFRHYPATELPEFRDEGLRLRCIAGRGFGLQSPVATASATLYVVAELAMGRRLELLPEYRERAVYVVEGDVDLGPERLQSGQLAVLPEDETVVAVARTASRLAVLGGEPLEGPRFIDWNFVSSSRERIHQAREDWRLGRFPSVPGETEFIPLPE